MRLVRLKCLSKHLSHLHNFNITKVYPNVVWTYQKQRRLFCTIRQSIISDLSLDIDIDGFKLKTQQLIRQGKKVNIHKVIEEELENKCLQFLNTLSLNPHQSKLLKVVQLEHSHLAAEGYSVLPPDKMTSKNWVEALTCSSADERLTYFLFIAHKHNQKVRNRTLELERKEEWEKDGMKEGESDNGIIFADEQKPRNGKWGNHRLSSSMMFGIPLVLDMDFEGKMTSKEIGETAKQLWKAYCTNRWHPQPFHLVLTGCSPANTVYRSLQLRHLLDCDHFLVTTSQESYLELYDPADIVYLTPHAKQCIQEFDPNATYVLGAYSDLLSRKKMAIAKARQQKIRCQRLPIDETIKWRQGNKDLFINMVVQILLKAKDKAEWVDAFSHALPPKCFKHY